MSDLLVRDLMTENPIAVGPEDTLASALDIMETRHIRHLPVVDERGDLIGLLTRYTATSSTRETTGPNIPKGRSGSSHAGRSNARLVKILVSQPIVHSPNHLFKKYPCWIDKTRIPVCNCNQCSCEMINGLSSVKNVRLISFHDITCGTKHATSWLRPIKREYLMLNFDLTVRIAQKPSLGGLHCSFLD